MASPSIAAAMRAFSYGSRHAFSQSSAFADTQTA